MNRLHSNAPQPDLFQIVARLCSIAAFLAFATLPANAQSALSQNSGINSNDTWVAFDISLTTSGSIDMPEAIYNPATQTSSTTFSVAPPSQTFHVEIGYDSQGALLMNLWPKGIAIDPDATDAVAIGFIRISKGQVTIFGQDGAPITPDFPSGISNTGWPFSLLGTNPGPLSPEHLIVSNIQSVAESMDASLTMSSDGTLGYISPPTPSGSAATWTYAQSGPNWIPQQFVLTQSPSGGGSVTQTGRLANMTWYDNAANDAERSSQGYTAQPFPAPTTTTPSGPAAATDPADSTVVYQLGGPQNVAFMHGLGSSGSTWTRMTGWLNQDFRFGNEVVPTFPWGDSLAAQGNDLINEVNSVGGSNYIFIGHSQGGLISRYAAQIYQGQNHFPPIDEGVVEVDAPNQGAPIVVTGGAALVGGLALLGNFLWGTAGCTSPNASGACWLAYAGLVGGGVAGGWFYSNGDVSDLTPGSSFLNQLNGSTEMFKRAAVVSDTPQWFGVARILSNAIAGPRAGCYPDTGCGEQNFALVAQIAFLDAAATFVFAEFEAAVCLNNDDFQCYYYWDGVANQAFAVTIGMEGIDLFWNAAVSGLSDSDEIVPASSQQYPSSGAVQAIISGADSHTGATTSPYVHTALYKLLGPGSQFEVPTQGSCGFSVSPTTFTISASGGSGTIPLSTGQGCNWSAVSQIPWITITTPSGTSGSNVGFSVAANPYTVPRYGSVQVGNGASSAVFTVDEAGICTYALSDGSGDSAIAFPSSGGTVTLSVLTQPGCVWSAASNASWLTISAGASGTGSGSFTLTAAANAASTSVSGTVTVMDQTFPIVVGAYDAGVASFTIRGQEGSWDYETDDPCVETDAGYGIYCPEYYQNSDDGTVTLTVGSYSVTYYWGQSDDPVSIASALAYYVNNGINSSGGSSPVTATSDGDTVLLFAVQAGSATNYSFNISVNSQVSLPPQFWGNYNDGWGYEAPPLPTPPSFWATQSGSNFTGGAN